MEVVVKHVKRKFGDLDEELTSLRAENDGDLPTPRWKAFCSWSDYMWALARLSKRFDPTPRR